MAEEIQLFATCIIDTLYPQVGKAVVRVLERAGVEVAFPHDQTCCGQPAFNAGMRSQARSMVEHTIKVFEATSGPVVVPSGSCAAMIRHGYLELFDGDMYWSQRAKSLAERTFEFTEFLVDYLGVTDIGACFHSSVAYHSSCHLLRDLGVSEQPQALLSAVEGLDFIELPYSDECCGFGGVFSVEFPHVSAAMLERKISNIESSGAEVITSCDAGCITHINGGLHRRGQTPRVMHIAEILEKRDGQIKVTGA
jgi:L-lactate dehydrogenase complex protein LldE